MGGLNMTKVKSGHGLSGSGKGKPPMMGVTGPGGNFIGTTIPQDTQRSNPEYSGEGDLKGKTSIGGAKGKTGGMSRKGMTSVGPGGY